MLQRNIISRKIQREFPVLSDLIIFKLGSAIMKIYDNSDKDQMYCIVMKFLKQYTLAELIAIISDVIKCNVENGK